jgi:hypothetical protein
VKDCFQLLQLRVLRLGLLQDGDAGVGVSPDLVLLRAFNRRHGLLPNAPASPNQRNWKRPEIIENRKERRVRSV